MRRILFVLCLALAVLGAAAQARAWGELRCAERPLNVRKERDAASEHVRTLSPGERVKVDFIEDGWAAVFEPDEQTRSLSRAMGYCNARYLKPAAASAGAWGRLSEAAVMLNVRRERSPNSEHVRTLTPGERVKVDFWEDGWVAVFEPDEEARSLSTAIGYANAKYFRPLAAVALPVEQAPAEEVRQAPAAEPGPSVRAEVKRPFAVSRPQAAKTDKKVRLRDATLVPGRLATPPKADQVRHGFKYRILSKNEERLAEGKRLRFRVFLEVEVLPKADALRDFATTLWRENKVSGLELVEEIYLSGMDLDGLSYAVVRFDAEGVEEFWARRTALFGTGFFDQ
ncbi:MAG: SH3 domain-containing protein [Desulfovibrionaceae bacterium]|nr:SH3 domain-containing protein [Desulfovibrionaceae bacterium]